jgi:hypothetical protein
MRTLFWLSIALLAACDGGKDTTPTADPDGATDEGDADTDADADTDSDTDADADADSDADTDTGTPVVTGSTADTGAPPLECYADYAADIDVNGSIEILGVDLYDAVNNELLEHSDRDGDGATPPNGVPDYFEDYTYDANGNTTSYVLSIDVGPPYGLFVFFEDLTWDLATDDLLTYTADCLLVGPYYTGCFDGSTDYGESFAYDANGNLIHFEIDDNFNGVADYSEDITYDANDREILYEADLDGNGTIDYRWQTVWDTAVPPLFADELEDEDNNGTIDNSYHVTYDAAERVTEIASDLGDDGVVDDLEVLAYTDPVLFSGSYTYDEGNDGTAEFYQEFVSDADESLLYLADDSTPDGTFDYEYYQTWLDPERLLTQDFVDLSGLANALDYTYAITYDALNRIVLITFDEMRHNGGAVTYQDEQSYTFGGSCP